MSLSYNNSVIVRQSAAFYGTGAVQTFTVPAGVTAIRFFLWGAGGGNQDGSSVIKNGVGGGSGAYMEGNLVVRPGAVYSIIVGKYGVAGLANGGGSTAKYGGPGGGFSGIFSSTPAANTVIAIAGGGGGSGVNGSGVGGGGGYPSGINGTASGAGTGGTQSAGGTGYQSGSQFAGGNGSLGQNGGGGGGGGGLYGGGSGADSTACGGGGGSSTYISSVINVVSINGNLGITTTGSNTPAANSSSPYWQSPYGQSAADGLVVIGYNQTLPAPQLRLSNETVINQTTSFLGTGAVQTWTVPAGVFNVKFFLWGSGGIGQNGVTNVSTAGGGGFVQGNLVTTPGTTYSIIVGRPGLTGLANGGSSTGGTSAGGGGFSGIFSATPAANTVIAIAGAGGGSGFNTGGYGGGGGYPNGLPGVGGQSQGGGGTQTAGGSSLATAGSQLTGGNGGGGDQGGGGGGGGWYGGGGGINQGAGGGGSSTYTSRVVNPATQNGTTGSQTGTVPTPPGGTTSPYWVSPYGSAGQNGLVVFGYTIAYAPPNLHTYKYVKFTVFLTRGGMSGANPEFQLSEFQLKIGGVFVNYTGITISPNTTGAEGSIRVIDGLVGTKYFAVSQGNSFTIISPSTFTFDSYTWATANDASSRDPVRWRVEGSTDNTNWIILDDRSTVTQTVTETRQVYLPDIQLPSSVPPSYSLSYIVPTETLLQAFTSTGAVQTYTVPANTVRIKMYAWGSGGGNGNASGGGGAFVSGALNVRAGQVLNIVVGRTSDGYPSIAQGGGGGRMNKYYGAGGGGFSGVFLGSPASDNCVCMAGGGGAGNVTSAGPPPLTGGPGGYPNGFPGSSGSGKIGGGGGTQSSGGDGGGGGPIANLYSGTRLFGGDGLTTASDGGAAAGWGSGGGGWFGGGASCQSSTNGGGGGGSGFIGGLQQPIQTENGSYAPTTSGTANAGGESNRYWQTPYGRSGQSGYVVLTRFQ